MNLRLFKLIYQTWRTGVAPTPPYRHIVQIGDPVLRLRAKTVDPTAIKEEPMQKLLSALYKLMKKTESYGLSAPQIGVSLRVFAIHCPTKRAFGHAALYEKRKMEPIPLQVWINPKIKVLDYQKEIFEETCQSMKGYAAEIPRYDRVLLEGLDSNGKLRKWEAKGWSARIVQHEMDHLDGKLYTDIMNPTSLCCTKWDAINRHGGRVYVSFMAKD